MDRLPAPFSPGAVALCDPPNSITVAGAAPALDHSAPDFPFNRSYNVQPQPATRVGADTSRGAQPACAAQPASRAIRAFALHGMICDVGMTKDDTRTTQLNTVAEWAGYLGVAPLVLCLAAVGLLPAYAWQELAQRAALAWGALLLAAAAAVHWGLALAGRLPSPRARIAVVLAAASAGAGAVVVGGQRGLAVLVVGHGGFWFYEKHGLGSLLPEAHLALRRQVTFVTCMLLALTMFVSDTAGLS